MDVSGRILRAWMPAIHAGMTEAADGQKPRRTLAAAWRDVPFSCSLGERKIMDHFVVNRSTALFPELFYPAARDEFFQRSVVPEVIRAIYEILRHGR